jgi:hypothetical protein
MEKTLLVADHLRPDVQSVQTIAINALRIVLYYQTAPANVAGNEFLELFGEPSKGAPRDNYYPYWYPLSRPNTLSLPTGLSRFVRSGLLLNASSRPAVCRGLFRTHIVQLIVLR